MKTSLTLVIAASFLILAATITGSTSASVFGQQSSAGIGAASQQTPQESPQAQPSPKRQRSEQMEKQEVTGKIEAVDEDQNTVQVQGTNVPIVATASTRYSRGLSFKSLKPGMEVKIVAVLRSDGKLEALEVRSA